MLEFVARLDWMTRILAPSADRPAAFLIDKHFQRKHGPKASYGQ